jgi:hypothetical protein
MASDKRTKRWNDEKEQFTRTMPAEDGQGVERQVGMPAVDGSDERDSQRNCKTENERVTRWEE